MALLTGNEYKCLSFVARKTFGWQKRSDRISKSQIAAATGMNQETVDRSMNALLHFGLVLRVAENDQRYNVGNEWALQTNDELIRFDLLEERLNGLTDKRVIRTTKARQKKADRKAGEGTVDEQPGGGVDEQPGGTVDEQPGGGVDEQPGGTVDEQPTQKPIKAKENMGAAAPGSPVGKIEKRNVPENVGANAPETSGETSSESSRTIGESSETFSQNAGTFPQKAGTFPEPSESSPAETALETRIAAFPEETRETVRLMLQLFGVRPPEKPAPNEKGGDFALWL